jgi:hypothetical protein
MEVAYKIIIFALIVVVLVLLAYYIFRNTDCDSEENRGRSSSVSHRHHHHNHHHTHQNKNYEELKEENAGVELKNYNNYVNTGIGNNIHNNTDNIIPSNTANPNTVGKLAGILKGFYSNNGNITNPQSNLPVTNVNNTGNTNVNNTSGNNNNININPNNNFCR